MLEVFALPGAGISGVEADPVATAGEVTTELYVVAGSDPSCPLVYGDRLRTPKHTVRPSSCCQGPGEARRPLDVVDCDHRGAGGELGSYLLPPLLFITRSSEHLCGVAGTDNRDGLRQQGAAGSGLRLVYEGQRHRTGRGRSHQ